MILLSNGEEALEAGQNAETRRRCPIPQDDACAEYATDSILRIRDGLALVRELTIRIRGSEGHSRLNIGLPEGAEHAERLLEYRLTAGIDQGDDEVSIAHQRM